MPKVVRQKIDNKTIYRQMPDFEDGKGLLSASFITGLKPEDLQEVAISQAEWDAEIAVESAVINRKKISINTNMPSYLEIDNAITNITSLADVKVFLRRLSRVVYWLAKDSID